LIERGGYVLQAPAGTPDVVLIATGSEVSIAMTAAEQLSAEGMAVQVVSMPCMERFLAQEAAYREQVLPSAVRRRVAIEAGSTGLWYQFVGLEGAVIGIDSFGESAPGDVLYRHFGLVPERVVAAVKILG
jgi:transketolase